MTFHKLSGGFHLRTWYFYMIETKILCKYVTFHMLSGGFHLRTWYFYMIETKIVCQIYTFKAIRGFPLKNMVFLHDWNENTL